MKKYPIRLQKPASTWCYLQPLFAITASNHLGYLLIRFRRYFWPTLRGTLSSNQLDFLGPFSESVILILATSFQWDLGPVIDLATSLPLLSSAGTTMLCPWLYVWDRCPAETLILFATSGQLRITRVHH